MRTSLTSSWIRSIKSWHFFLIGILASEVFTYLFSTFSLTVFYPGIGLATTSIVYKVGMIDALFVSIIVIVLFLTLKSAYEKELTSSHLQTLRTNKQLEQTVEKLAYARDVAIQSERTATSASKSKSTFLANVSHELRTPLNAIIGYSELIKETALEEGQVQYSNDIDKIIASSHHLLKLINSLLDLAKIEAGKMDLYIESADITKLVTDVCSIVSPLAAQNCNSLICNIDPAINFIMIDEVKIRQSLINLLSNAIKFTHDGFVRLDVTLFHQQSAQQLQFTVTDTGIGMSEEQMANIFQFFSQADRVTTKHYGGTGLGLAITQQFAHLMGGSIDVTSKQGSGTTFILSVPVICPSDLQH